MQKFFRQSANSIEEADTMYIHFSLWRRQLSPFDKGAICWDYVDHGAREFWVSAINRSSSLGRLGNRLYSTPANSVPSERSFSTQNFIHSKVRNCLKPERVNKLTYIYMNSRVFRVKKEREIGFDLYELTAEEEQQFEEELMQEEEEEEMEMEVDANDDDEFEDL